MTDDRDKWLPIADAARQFRILPDTIRTWARRGVVRSHRHRGRVAVHTDDVAAAEHEWRTRGKITGRRGRLGSNSGRES
ncbi:hypothetical protein GCM10025875_36210 [Litorihabitans aurantiacus]|uniref:HTH merR-type domain-containing protein n=1 Tax=Litorihabitans aurantiacus TaxID=1930061 RepID=A0AA37XIA8_9MICO|nr:hypothetical protein GCM10025875_35100 [Litorihabitans aurantiacus]GMA33629.1 hypothetical protein GCM10025875_36210 [Litorihabitans aurantiacus]